MKGLERTWLGDGGGRKREKESVDKEQGQQGHPQQMQANSRSSKGQERCVPAACLMESSERWAASSCICRRRSSRLGVGGATEEVDLDGVGGTLAAFFAVMGVLGAIFLQNNIRKDEYNQKKKHKYAFEALEGVEVTLRAIGFWFSFVSLKATFLTRYTSL